MSEQSPGAPFTPTCQPPKRLFPPVSVDPTGIRGPTKSQAAGPGWVRVGHNAYVPASVDRNVPEQRAVEAASRLSPEGAVTGWAALRLHGAAYFDGRGPGGQALEPVLLALGSRSGRRGDSQVQLSYEPVTRAEVVRRQGVSVLCPVRSLFDEMRRVGNWRDAVVALDMAAAAELVSVRQLSEHLAAHSGWRRSTQVVRALSYASELSRSPAETRLRLLWVIDAALPPPLVNQEVFDRAGRLVCIADLLDVDAGLVIEYDGAEHRRAHRHSQDVAREERCRTVGLEYCKITGPDMHHRDRVLARFQATRSRARFATAGARLWTLDRPARRPTRESLEDRLALREWLQERCG